MISSGVVTESIGAPPSRERVELILAQIDRLPTLPSIVARLLAATSAEDSSAKDLVAILSADATLTAALLRMVRRADLGTRSDSMTVAKAVTLLGFGAVRGLALAVEVFQALQGEKSNDATQARRRGLWTHALAVACLSEMIGERLRPPRRDGTAFVCGLLHDIGKVALDVCLPKSYARVVEQVERERICICDAERALFGMDHTLAGKRLATRWGLSQAVIDCVWLHHQDLDALPSSVVDPTVLAVVHLADNLARRHGVGYSGYPNTGDVAAIGSRLGLDEVTLEDLIRRLPDRMRPLAEMLGLDGALPGPLSEEALLQANRELSRSNEQLRRANEQLERRVPFLDALDTFGQSLSPQAAVQEVCRAAADAVRVALGVERCVAAAFDPAHRVVRMGSSPADTGSAESQVLESSVTLSLFDSLRHLGSSGFGTLAPAPTVCERIWSRFGPVSEAQPLWVLPIGRDEEVDGAVLFTAPESTARTLRSCAAECRALLTILSAAMISARLREQADHLAEELLDLNRRLQAGQRDALRRKSVSMIAKMAAGAAHELNNPLSVIAGRAQMAISRDDVEDKNRALGIIQEHARRASQIVTDLMRFAKPESPRPQEQFLPGVVEALFQRCVEHLGVGAERLSATFADPECRAFCDPEHLVEILTSLATNAVEAAGAEHVRLSVNSPSEASDEYVRLVVHDDGPGMSREVLEHALDPFFSHREAGRGRGLGLSKAFRLAEINGGRLWIDSEPGAGTTVTLELATRRTYESNNAQDPPGRTQPGPG